MARRALVIGLGTTGTHVCNNLIERLEWEHGSLERTPWIRFLAIETASVAGQPVTRSADVVQLHVCRNPKLLQVLSNPTHWQDQIEPSNWVDQGIRHAMENISGEGAGNIRQAGRLALLYPEHFRAVKDAVQDRLLEVHSLRVEHAQLCFDGREGDPTYPLRARRPGESDFALTGDVDVYVVGSLCGGTSSGSFLDLAYLIRNSVPAYRTVNPHLLGLFAGYPANGTKNWLGANAYCALREYNHWATPGITFEAMYDGDRIRDKRAPYDEFHLVLPPTDAPESVQQIENAVSDYIYVRTFCSEADVVDGARSNFATGYASLSKQGTHQVMASFGISGIEFPARRLVEACQLKLIEGGLTQWLDDENGSEARQSGLQAKVQQDLTRIGILGEGLLGGLLASASGERSVMDRIHDHIQGRGFNSGGDLAELDECDAQMEIALGAAPPEGIQAAPSLPYACVKDGVGANRDRLRRELREKLAAQLRLAFLKPDEGPAYCRAYTRQASDFLATEMKRYQPDPQTGRAAIQLEAEQAKERKDAILWELESVQHDTFLKLLWGRGWAVARLSEEWVEASEEYYRLRVADVQRVAVLDILKIVYEDLQRYLQRLGTDSHVVQYGRVCLRELSSQLEDVIRRPPPTNYETVLPVNRENVDAQFQMSFQGRHDPVDAWREKVKTAHADTLQALRDWAEAVFSTPDTPENLAKLILPAERVEASRLDVRPEDRKSLMGRTRGYFEAIERVHILQRLEELGSAEAKRLTDSMLRKCAPMLPVDSGDSPRWENLSKKHAGFVFYNGQRHMRAQAERGDAPREVRFFGNLLAAPAGDGSGEAPADVISAESVEWHRVTAVQEQTAFPLAVVEGFLPGGIHEGYYRKVNDLPTYYSRSDIAFWYPLEPDPGTEDIVRWLLVLIATGKIDPTRPQLHLRVPGQPQPVMFSREMKKVRIEYAGDPPHKQTVVTAMTNEIVAYRRTHGAEALVVAIGEFLARAGQCGLWQEEGVALNSQAAESWLIPYLRQDSELWVLWKNCGHQPPQVDPFVLLRQEGDLILRGPKAPLDGPKAQEKGYYCDQCGFRFGPNEADVKRARVCIGCGKAFVFD